RRGERRQGVGRVRRGGRHHLCRDSAAAPIRALGGDGGRVTGSRRVLVCDDEPQVVRALKVVLQDAGFDVIPASTAEEALDQAAVRPPEAAIVDLVLPDGDGV